MAVPTAPTLTTLTATHSDALQCVFSVGAGSDHTNFYGSTDGGATYTYIMSVVAPTASDYLRFLLKGEQYHIKARGENADGESLDSNVLNATTLAALLKKVKIADGKVYEYDQRSYDPYFQVIRYAIYTDGKIFANAAHVDTDLTVDNAIHNRNTLEYFGDNTAAAFWRKREASSIIRFEHYSSGAYQDDSFRISEEHWDDLQINISNVRIPAANAPTWTAYKGSFVLAFSAGSDEIIYFTAQLPHAYLEGSDIDFHLHVVFPDTGAGDVRWNFTHSWANIGVDFPAETTVNTDLASPADADNHTLHEVAATITGTGKTISSMLLCSLQREGSHGNDTYGNNVYLIGADFHVKRDSIGSDQEASKTV